MCHAPQEAGPGGEGGNGGVGGVLSSFWSLQVPSQLAHSQLCVCVCVLRGFSCIRLFVTPWTAAHQAPLSMGFSRQEYWRGLPCPPPGDLPNPGIELESPVSPALAGEFFTAEPLGNPKVCTHPLVAKLSLYWGLLPCSMFFFFFCFLFFFL